MHVHVGSKHERHVSAVVQCRSWHCRTPQWLSSTPLLFNAGPVAVVHCLGALRTMTPERAIAIVQANRSATEHPASYLVKVSNVTLMFPRLPVIPQALKTLHSAAHNSEWSAWLINNRSYRFPLDPAGVSSACYGLHSVWLLA